MHRFPCPHCGERDEVEFFYGGDAGRTRPPRDCDEATWARYRFFRTNAKGVARELWLHASGCGRWFVMERDTATHEIRAAEALGP